MNYQKAIEEFKQLNHDKQKERLLRLLRIFVGNGKIFDELMAVTIKEQTTQQQLIDIYTLVVESMNDVLKGDMKAMVDKLEWLKDYLHKLHEKEAAERAKENPDALLDNL